MAVADHVGLDDADRASGNARRGPAHAIGAADIERIDQCRIDAAGGEHGVDQQRTLADRTGDGGGEALF
ncbi:hypothetical protein WR25_08723 [Diploscapter pachys]|uniref:Uncharacterized protein n=1 Tax=Diploscapter pachys TaxID=2018661 RepID=A0A2A2M5Y9_9BILA|nr:hypothetical protein WR25_08723 [Diploscapter pachys]